ncbi:MAG: hypothetical protein N2662_01840 [Bacteroidales bacterium]|nr:hypothetical protein [Bacteroidales bacterium]
MKRNFLFGFAVILLMGCKSSLTTVSRSVVPLPPLKLSRNDYKITDDLSATVEAKEVKLLGFLKFATIIGEDGGKYGYVNGYNANSPAVNLALYKIFENNKDLDYVINIRVRESFDEKDFVLFKVKKTKTTVLCKGIKINKD